MKKNAIFITIAVMISNILVKFLGLARDVVLANTYGTSIYSDAYIVASNIPIVIFSVVAAAISTSFIPMYSEINEREGEKEALKFTNNFINIVIVISLLICILGEFFPGFFVKLFAYGFTDEAYNLTVNFTKIMIPSIIITAIMSVSGSYLQLKEDFLPISYVSIPNNIIVIISILVAFYSRNPYILAIGTLLGMISQLIYYYPFLKRNKYKYSGYLNLKDKYIKKTLLMIMPVFIGAAVNEVNVIIDRSLVSGLEQGSIAALNYASKLIGFITGVFIVSIITIIYPKMSELSAKLNLIELRKYLSKIFLIISILIAPITLISIIYSKDIVRIIFERGSFDSQSTYMTGIALASYSIGLIGIGFREVLTKAYFSIKDTKTPMINGIIAVIFNVILNIILINRIGFVGSAIATSISSILTSLLLLTKLEKKIGKIINLKMLINLVKILCASFISCMICNMIYGYFTYSTLLVQIIALITTIIVTILIYILILILLKESIIKEGLGVIKLKVSKRR